MGKAGASRERKQTAFGNSVTNCWAALLFGQQKDANGILLVAPGHAEACLLGIERVQELVFSSGVAPWAAKTRLKSIAPQQL